MDRIVRENSNGRAGARQTGRETGFRGEVIGKWRRRAGAMLPA
jgi:hypothetical protein